MNLSLKRSVWLALVVLIFPGELLALPAYRRLWEGKYKYKMSCVICHARGGGSELNGYGRDFQRFGMTPGAFKTIESRDSDGDGFKNIDEIRAKSNPGDSRSTPNNATDWLERIERSMLPLAQLQDLFPGVKKFSSLEGTLLPEQIEQVEKALGEKLLPQDTVPTFYFAIQKVGDKFKRKGVSLFVTPTGREGKMTVAVGMDLSGKITRVLLIKNTEDEKLYDEEFLSQFSGKSVDDSLEVGKDIRPVPEAEDASKLVSRAVKKALYIVQVVFSKKK